MANLGNTTRPAYVYDAETDTWLPIGVGAHSHDYTSQFIGKTLVDAKGDIVTASANDVPAILSKGSDGTVLVADSTTSTGLAWQPYAAPFVAGKNKIINGDFGIWQRDTTFSPPGAGSYTADRWRTFYITAVPTTYVVSRQTFTPGSEPVSGYNSPYFWRGVLTTVGAATEVGVQQRIEDVGTFANTTVTISFYAKSDSNRTQTVGFQQNFGSGGSSTVGLTAQTINTTASWQRFSLQFAIPSISGKTIGANSYLQATISQNLTNGNTLDIWGWQVEAGPIATPFTTATGTIQGELAACQRYYWRETAGTTYTFHAQGYAMSTTNAAFLVKHPVRMRTVPSSVEYANLAIDLYGVANYTFTNLYIVSTTNGIDNTLVEVSGSSGLTANRPYFLAGNNNAGNYIGFSAEL
jgi:hypothetical protein